MQFVSALHSYSQSQSGEQNMTDIIPSCREQTSFKIIEGTFLPTTIFLFFPFIMVVYPHALSRFTIHFTLLAIVPYCYKKSKNNFAQQRKKF
jgi:hypothetical protein